MRAEGLNAKEKPKPKKMKQGGMASKNNRMMLAYPSPRQVATLAPTRVKQMAETATIMAEEMQPEKKIAFANRKYTNEEKRKMEEEELSNFSKNNVKVKK